MRCWTRERVIAELKHNAAKGIPNSGKLNDAALRFYGSVIDARLAAGLPMLRRRKRPKGINVETLPEREKAMAAILMKNLEAAWKHEQSQRAINLALEAARDEIGRRGIA